MNNIVTAKRTQMKDIDEYNKIDEYRNEILETEFKIVSSVDLYTAIDKLNEKFKSIVILRYLEDMTITQISEVLGLPKGTVKIYLRRALEVLKIELLRDRLEKVIAVKENLVDCDVIFLSQELDKLISNYYSQNIQKQ
jgi:DNA-directed RNA polymerase specialized sigma24 family protein